MAALANGRLGQQHQSRRDLLPPAQGSPATSCRSIRPRRRKPPGRRRSSSTGTTTRRVRQRHTPSLHWKWIIPKNNVVSSYYQQAIVKNAPHPAAARLWEEFLYSSTGQNWWLRGGAHPVLQAHMTKAGSIDKTALKRAAEGERHTGAAHGEAAGQGEPVSPGRLEQHLSDAS